LLFNGFLTLITTASQLYLDLRWDTASIEERIGQVARSDTSTLANALWAYDADAIQLDLRGIRQLPDIAYVRISTPTGDTFTEGTPPVTARRISRTFELWHHEDDSERVRLGTFEVTASLESAYARLFRRAITILGTNALKTFPISIFILLVFQRLVTRHLDTIANYAKRLDLDRLDVPLVLNRQPKGSKDDELTHVVNAINAMRDSLSTKIEERQLAERVIQESEARLRAIMDGSPAVIYIKDAAGRYELVNRRFAELFGVDRDTIRGKTDFDIFPRDAAERFCATDQRVLKDGKATDIEEAVPHRDGIHTYISLKFPIFDAEGRPSAVCGISTDVTDRKRIEDSRNQLLAETQEMLQLREDFIAVTSHELRTPVATLTLHADLLDRTLDKATAASSHELAPVSKAVKVFKRQTEHLGRLVDSLLDASRRGRLDLTPVPVDLSRLVREVALGYQNQVASTKEQVFLDLQPDVCGTWDILKIEQVVLNLLTNAVKYGQGKPIRIVVRSDADSAILVVEDSGIGIPPEAQGRVFGRFERAVPTARYGGIGLGLYITRKIVEAHGGSIEVQSESGEGSRFTVRLPLRPQTLS